MVQEASENEHAATLRNADDFARLRRVNDRLGQGIDVVFGFQTGDDDGEIQSIKFRVEEFTEAEARRWLEDSEFEIIEFEAATPRQAASVETCELGEIWLDLSKATREAIARCDVRLAEAFHLRDTHWIPAPESGSCPTSHPSKLNSPEGEPRCYTASAASALRRSRTSEQEVPSGIHDHPHEADGVHDHLGLPAQTGGHEHERSSRSGGHSHRTEDPIEGFHLGDPGDTGAHVHILALADQVPELRDWCEKVADAHFPSFKWLEGHARTLIVEGDAEPRPTTREDWQAHCLWSMHSAGANLQQHIATTVDESTRFMRWTLEFEDGTSREVTPEDFEKEVAWLNENLPFPREAIERRLQMENENIHEAVLPFRDLPLADIEREWDADAARGRLREWATSDDEIDFDRYARAFIIVDGDRDNLTSYKLPVGDIIDGELMAVPRGIFAVGGVLSGARGGADLSAEDLAGAKIHVSRYFRKMDREPPFEKESSGHEPEEQAESFRESMPVGIVSEIK